MLLDSGTSISRMHYQAARPILEALGAEDYGEGHHVVPCKMRDVPGSADFFFGEKVVHVPFGDFVVDIGSATWCYVGIMVTTEQQLIGDTVMRAAYFVLDWDNRQVHVAQAAHCGDEDIVVVDSGKDAVPSVTGHCKPADGSPTTTDSASGDGYGTGDGDGDGDGARARPEVDGSLILMLAIATSIGSLVLL